MFPPKGGAGAPPPRNLRDIRRSVGTTMPEPAVEEPKGSTATVSMTCKECGARNDLSFTADESGGEPPAGPPLPTTGAGPV
jgi:hypothetical protein